MGYHSAVNTLGNPEKAGSSFSTLDPALKRGGRLGFERRITLLALFAGLPAVALCVLLLWLDDYSARTQWTIDLVLVVVWLSVVFSLKERVIRPLQTLSNILAALHEGDYSIRARRATIGDALGEVLLETNELGQTLRQQRLGALEATALLRTVMSEIEAAGFPFFGEQRLRLVNRAGEKLLAQTAARLLGRTGKELGLMAWLRRPDQHPRPTKPLGFPQGVGRWGVHRMPFFQLRR